MSRAQVGDVLVPQRIEKCLVPNDRAAKADRVLVNVSPVRLQGIPLRRFADRLVCCCSTCLHSTRVF